MKPRHINPARLTVKDGACYETTNTLKRIGGVPHRKVLVYPLNPDEGCEQMPIATRWEAVFVIPASPKDHERMLNLRAVSFARHTPKYRVNTLRRLCGCSS